MQIGQARGRQEVSEAVTAGVKQRRNSAYSSRLPGRYIGLTDRTTLARKVNHPKSGAAASPRKGAMQL